MKRFFAVTAVALMMGVPALAFAAPNNTTITPGTAASVGMGGPTSNSGPQVVAAIDPAADIHDGNKSDYRLSCPFMQNMGSDPTVDNCRKLYAPPSPPHY